nr:pentatricopeptide repeat-containing protein At4g01400, mitochondrial-like [Quercus suber]
MKITKMNRASLPLSFLLTCLNSTVKTRIVTHSFYSSIPQHPHQNQNQNQSQKQQQKQHLNSNTPIGLSPSRVQKLIASQTDPLLAKEIFDYASNQPNFRHSYSSYLTLILKLGRSNYFSLIDNLLISLKTHHYSLPPSLFSHLIKLYGNANLPNKALKTFYTIMEFNCRPSVKHLNCILEILVSHRNYVRPAFQLFRNAHCYGVEPNTKSYNTLMRAFCFCGDLSIAYQLFNEMFKRDVVPDVESYRILMQGLCRKSQVNKAVDLLEDMLNKGYVPDTLSYTTLLNSLCRKKQLREAYKLLCRMKVKGCNPDIVHYNTVILGFCRESQKNWGELIISIEIIGSNEELGQLKDTLRKMKIRKVMWFDRVPIEARKFMGGMGIRLFNNLLKEIVPKKKVIGTQSTPLIDLHFSLFTF